MSKKFLKVAILFLLLPISVFAYTSPGKPLGFVSDYAGIIPLTDQQNINETLLALKNSTNVEISVVTVKSLDNDTVENFAVKLFEEWGIGEKGKDNGLLILIAPNEREVRIEVGYGLEGTITDIQASNIIQSIMIPAFREGNYSLGIKETLNTLIGIINKTIDPNQFSKTTNNQKISPEAIIFFLFILFNIFSYKLSKTKSWWMGGLIGAGIGVIISIFAGFLYFGLLSIVGLSILGLIFDYIVSKHGPRNGPGGFWTIGGFGGGRGGGGFGGFGGGFSGGGGASGRW